MFDLSEPRFTPFEVLNVTELKPETIQTWVNRNVIRLAEQNPGRGKRRMYSALDVVKLSIMRRMDDLKIALSTAVEIAEATAERLQDSNIEWDLYIFLRPRSEENTTIKFISSGDALSKYSPTVGDPWHMRVSDCVETFEGVISRRDKKSLTDADYSDDRPVNPDKREALARQGFHAEPVIIFPLGEIVNGTLARLRAIDEVK